MSVRVRWLVTLLLLGGIGGSLHLLSGTGPAGAGGWGRAGLRLLVVAQSLAVWFLTQSLIGARAGKGGAGIVDAVHEWTTPLHGWLTRNVRATNGILIASSAVIDLFGLFLIGSALVGPSLRPFVALLLLFAFRQVCQLTCALPVPKGMIWRNPGFPSLLVTYHVSNDFFISGHTAIAVLGAIELAQSAPLWLGVTAAVAAVLEGVTVLVLRAHYTMDVLGAVVAAFVAMGLAEQLCR